MNISIIKNDRDNLIVKGSPETFLIVFIVIWSSFFGGIPTMIFPALAYQLLEATGTKTLSCQKPVNQPIACQEKQETFLGFGETLVKDLPPLKQAKLNQISTNEDFDDSSITLITEEGEINLFTRETDQIGLRESSDFFKTWVNEINNFLASDQPNLTLEYPISKQWLNFIPIPFIATFPLIAFGVLYFALQTHKLNFDRLTNEIIYQQQTILGSKSKTYSWRDIRGLELTKRRGNKGAIFYQLNFLTYHSTKLPVLVTNKPQPLQELGQQLRELLKVDFNDKSHQFR
jgi:hypothetical protein